MAFAGQQQLAPAAYGIILGCKHKWYYCTGSGAACHCLMHTFTWHGFALLPGLFLGMRAIPLFATLAVLVAVACWQFILAIF